MVIKIKKLNVKAAVPVYAKPGDAGLDLVAVSKEVNGEQITYGTGLAMEIPEGHVGLVFPRSSIKNYSLSLSNAVGVIDSAYRGEIKAVFNTSIVKPLTVYEVGDKVAQLLILPYPKVNFVESESLSETVRGEGGWGSTGK